MVANTVGLNPTCKINSGIKSGYAINTQDGSGMLFWEHSDRKGVML
jgi:hypothetical protein